MKANLAVSVHIVFALLVICNFAEAQQGDMVAVVRGDVSGSAHIMLQNLGEKVDDYPQNADLWDKLGSYWLIWVGWTNSNPAVRTDFADNGEEFQNWLKAGGAFVATTASSDIHEIYELLPGKVRTHNTHSSRETAHVVAEDHEIVNEPHDITDDAYYAGWAWTAGDTYTEWEEYTVITTETEKENSEPSWLVHESMPVVVTTIQPTWSGHMHPKMTENILDYVKTLETAVEAASKLATTWASVKISY